MWTLVRPRPVPSSEKGVTLPTQTSYCEKEMLPGLQSVLHIYIHMVQKRFAWQRGHVDANLLSSFVLCAS